MFPIDISEKIAIYLEEAYPYSGCFLEC